VRFNVGGKNLTYGDFYRGFGLFCTAYLLFGAFLAWHLAMGQKHPAGNRRAGMGFLRTADHLFRCAGNHDWLGRVAGSSPLLLILLTASKNRVCGGVCVKVGIVGAGAVGTACLTSIITRGVACEVVLVNRNRKRADGVITDVQYGAALQPHVRLRAGEYADLSGAALIMVTAGVNEKDGGATNRNDPKGRLNLLHKNAQAYEDIIPKITQAAPDAVILVVTDPPDPLADLVLRLGHKKVLSTGTYLDSLRFRFHLAQKLEVTPQSVEAIVIGEHGTSQVFLWSSASIGGRSISQFAKDKGVSFEQFKKEIEQEVRYANITIIEGTGASVFGIGVVSARIAEIVLRDERTVIPIGSFNPDFGATLSLPSVLGRHGVSRILMPEMSEQERELLEKSARAIRDAAA
jgi:L-lactate dehydrogenase